MTEKPNYDNASTFYRNPVKMSVKPDKTEVWACIDDIVEGQLLQNSHQGAKAKYVKAIIDFWPAKGSWKDRVPMMFHVEIQYA